jgi:hypothetical protein
MEVDLGKIAMIVGLLFFVLFLVNHVTNSSYGHTTSTTNVIRPGYDHHGINPHHPHPHHQYYN